MLFTAIAAGYALTRPITYTVDATFRDEELSSPNIALTAGVLSFDPEDAEDEEERSPAALVMRSRRILVPLIKDLDLQGVVVPVCTTFGQKVSRAASKVRKRATANLIAELARHRKPGAVVVPDHKRVLRCHGVEHSGETTRSVAVEFVTATEFRVSKADGSEIGGGVLDEPFSAEGMTFVLSRGDAEGGLFGKTFDVTLLSMHPVINWLARAIEISTEPDDDSTIHLRFRGRDRRQAAMVLNRLMELYKEHLEQEARLASKRKLQYLEERRKGMVHEMEAFLSSRERAFTSGIGAEKYLDYKTHVQVLGERQEEYKEKLTEVDKVVAALSSYQEGDSPLISEVVAAIPDLREPMGRIRALVRQRDSLLLDLGDSYALERTLPSAAIRDTEALCAAEGQVERLRKAIVEHTGDAVRSLGGNTVTSTLPPFRIDAPERHNGGLYGFLRALHQVEVMRVDALKQHIAYPTQIDDSFRGFNLEMANALYLEYSQSLDDLEKEVRDLCFAIERIDDPEFSISSLSGQLDDEVSQGIIDTASTMEEKLAHDRHYTAKEQRHFHRYLDRQTELLADHATERLEIAEKNEVHYRSKVQGLQRYMVALINNELAVMKKQVADGVATQLSGLQQEQVFLQDELVKIESALAELPEKWSAEQEWDIQGEIFGQMAKALTEMVETMNMSYHMQAVNSGPIDLAAVPLAPTNPKLMRFALLGSVTGLLMAGSWLLCLAFARGFPATPYNLDALGGHVVGHAVDRRRGEADIETLRRIVAASAGDRPKGRRTKRGRTLLLQLGAAVDVSDSVADLISRQGDSVVVVRVPDRGVEQGTRELIGYLHKKRKTIPITKGERVHTVKAGGSSPYIAELVSSSRFEKMLATLKKKYDWVVVVSRAPVDAVETQRLFDLCDETSVMVTTESVGLLWPYLASGDGSPASSFAFSERSRKRGRWMPSFERIKQAVREARQNG